MASTELYNSKLSAGDYDKADGVSTYSMDGKKFLLPAANTNGWAAYNNLDLTEVSGIEITYFAQQAPQYGYTIEVLLDGLQGTKLGEATVGPGMKIAPAPNTALISFAPISDGRQHTLYFRLKAADAAEKTPIGIASWQLISK